MKRIIILLAFSVLACVSAEPGESYAQQEAEGKNRELWSEANRVWRGDYSLEDLPKWETRLKRFSADQKWPKAALSHNVIGVIQYNQGNLAVALHHFDESLQISREKRLDKLTAHNLWWSGHVYWDQGRGEEAVRSFTESAQIAQRIGSQGLAGKSIHMLGAIARNRGRYRESTQYVEQAMEIARAQGDDLLLMFCLYDMGKIQRAQGAPEKAEDCFNQSLDLARKLERLKWEALNLAELGDLCSRRQDDTCASSRYRQAVDIFESLNNIKGLALTYNKMGKSYLRMSDVNSAFACLEKSHGLAIQMGLAALVAETSLNLGRTYSRMGRPEEALARTDEALALYREIDIPDLLRQCYLMKGTLLERKGDIPGAEKNYREAVKILETLRQDVAGNEEEMFAFVEMRGKSYQKLIAILLKEGKVAEALEFLERSRLNRLREQFDQLAPQLGNGKEEEAKSREKELREGIETARTQLVEEKSKPKDAQDAAKISLLQTQLNEKRQHYFEYINDLREKFPELAALLAVQPDNLIDLQSLLPPGSAILQYLVLEDGLYAFIVSHDSVSHTEVRVTQTDLEGKIDFFRSLLMNPQIPLNAGPLEAGTLRPEDRGRSDAYEMFIDPMLSASQELYRILIKPLEAELAGARLLGIIPNGKLHLLPFEALGEREGQGRFRFLLEKKSVFYLNSQSILKFAQNRAKQIGENGALLAFGDPDRSLVHAEKEVHGIEGIFSLAKVYFGPDASEDKAKKSLKGFNILHFATHGKMQGNIKDSYVLLAPSPDGREDGKLYLREIWGLPLLGYQLVTLSACETATGKDASGDVMVSLETAFLRAGAPTILASLWEVDDEATGLLMKTFYDNLRKGEKAEALRAAKETLMNDPRFVHPYYWAPFIVVGDWR